MTPTVSIIVPVYNVENYITRCIDSLINQTLTNIEIILVNDGSTDSSGNICDKFAEIDSRINVIHKSNGGLSDARNVGIDNAQGEFIAFVDSDDYIHKDMYEILLKAIIENKCDVAESGYKEVFENEVNNNSKLNYSNNNGKVYSGKGAVLSTIMDHHCRTYVWNKLYRKELWNDIRFPYGKLFEDAFTTYRVIDKATKIVKLDEILYYYFQRSNSIVNSKFSIKKLDHCDALEEMLFFVENKYPDIAPIACLKFFSQSLPNLQELIINRKNISDSDVFIENLTTKLTDSKFDKYLNVDIEKLCDEILENNYDFFLKQKKFIKIRLFLLKKSIWSFYLFNKSISPIKNTIKKLAA